MARSGEIVAHGIVVEGLVRKGGIEVTRIEIVHARPCIHTLVFHHLLFVLHHPHLLRLGAPVVGLHWSNDSVDVKDLLKIHRSVHRTVLGGWHYYIDHDRC